MDYTILGIDQGNGNVKTRGCVFPCGFKKISHDNPQYHQYSFICLKQMINCVIGIKCSRIIQWLDCSGGYGVVCGSLPETPYKTDYGAVAGP